MNINYFKKTLNAIIFNFVTIMILNTVNATESVKNVREQIKLLSREIKNDENSFKKILEYYPKECQVFLKNSKIPWNDRNIATCFYKSPANALPKSILTELVNRLLTHQPAVSKKTLGSCIKPVERNV